MEPKPEHLSQNLKIKSLENRNVDLENYLRNTIIPQLFFDKDLVLRKFTPSAMKQFDLTEEDIGCSIHDIINNLRYPSIIHNIKWVMAKGKILEKEIQTTDLSWYQMNIIPYLEFLDDEPNGVIVTFVDITKRIKDLKGQEKIIEEYETLLDTISHDIKNRMTGMTLSIQLLSTADLEDKEELKFYIETLENSVSRVNLILAELFDSRDQKHKYGSVAELLNIENILEDVHLALLLEISNSNAVISFQIDSSEIVFSRRELRSILYNLISNAIKFRSPDRNPEILVKTKQEDNYMVISVKDNGLGIDPKNHEDIFSKFFRVEKSVAGTGIGLHLIQTLVINAGGRIEVESELGVGTEFRVYLKTACIK